MAEKDAATVLEEAADLLLIRGRCTGDGMDERGRYCVLGAIAEALGRSAGEWNQLVDSPPVTALADVARARVRAWPNLGHFYRDDPVHRRWISNDPARVVWFWNDIVVSAEDDDFEVIDTLRLVAKDLRNGAS